MSSIRMFARTAYERVFDRTRVRERSGRKALYAQFVRPGSLVLDIGANRGQVTDVLVELGARTVAVEPNPELADLLRRRYEERVEIVEAAVGSDSGECTLHIGARDAHSTVSDEWRRRAPAGHVWTTSIRVSMTTVDRLIETYGTPVLVKIDVEGFEPQVLAGLSTAVPALTFEYQAPTLEFAYACIDRLEVLGTYTFSHTLREESHLLSEFVPPARLREQLAEIAASDARAYGDVVAVLADSRG